MPSNKGKSSYDKAYESVYSELTSKGYSSEAAHQAASEYASQHSAAVEKAKDILSSKSSGSTIPTTSSNTTASSSTKSSSSTTSSGSSDDWYAEYRHSIENPYTKAFSERQEEGLKQGLSWTESYKEASDYASNIATSSKTQELRSSGKSFEEAYTTVYEEQKKKEEEAVKSAEENLVFPEKLSEQEKAAYYTYQTTLAKEQTRGKSLQEASDIATTAAVSAMQRYEYLDYFASKESDKSRTAEENAFLYLTKKKSSKNEVEEVKSEMEAYDILRGRRVKEADLLMLTGTYSTDAEKEASKVYLRTLKEELRSGTPEFLAKQIAQDKANQVYQSYYPPEPAIQSVSYGEYYFPNYNFDPFATYAQQTYNQYRAQGYSQEEAKNLALIDLGKISKGKSKEEMVEEFKEWAKANNLNITEESIKEYVLMYKSGRTDKDIISYLEERQEKAYEGKPIEGFFAGVSREITGYYVGLPKTIGNLFGIDTIKNVPTPERSKEEIDIAINKQPYGLPEIKNKPWIAEKAEGFIPRPDITIREAIEKPTPFNIGQSVGFTGALAMDIINPIKVGGIARGVKTAAKTIGKGIITAPKELSDLVPKFIEPMKQGKKSITPKDFSANVTLQAKQIQKDILSSSKEQRKETKNVIDTTITPAEGAIGDIASKKVDITDTDFMLKPEESKLKKEIRNAYPNLSEEDVQRLASAAAEGDIKARRMFEYDTTRDVNEIRKKIEGFIGEKPPESLTEYVEKYIGDTSQIESITPNPPSGVLSTPSYTITLKSGKQYTTNKPPEYVQPPPELEYVPEKFKPVEYTKEQRYYDELANKVQYYLGYESKRLVEQLKSLNVNPRDIRQIIRKKSFSPVGELAPSYEVYLPGKVINIEMGKITESSLVHGISVPPGVKEYNMAKNVLTRKLGEAPEEGLIKFVLQKGIRPVEIESVTKEPLKGVFQSKFGYTIKVGKEEYYYGIEPKKKVPLVTSDEEIFASNLRLLGYSKQDIDKLLEASRKSKIPIGKDVYTPEQRYYDELTNRIKYFLGNEDKELIKQLRSLGVKPEEIRQIKRKQMSTPIDELRPSYDVYLPGKMLEIREGRIKESSMVYNIKVPENIRKRSEAEKLLTRALGESPEKPLVDFILTQGIKPRDIKRISKEPYPGALRNLYGYNIVTEEKEYFYRLPAKEGKPFKITTDKEIFKSNLHLLGYSKEDIEKFLKLHEEGIPLSGLSIEPEKKIRKRKPQEPFGEYKEVKSGKGSLTLLEKETPVQTSMLKQEGKPRSKLFELKQILDNQTKEVKQSLDNLFMKEESKSKRKSRSTEVMEYVYNTLPKGVTMPRSNTKGWSIEDINRLPFASVDTSMFTTTTTSEKSTPAFKLDFDVSRKNKSIPIPFPSFSYDTKPQRTQKYDIGFPPPSPPANYDFNIWGGSTRRKPTTDVPTINIPPPPPPETIFRKTFGYDFTARERRSRRKGGRGGAKLKKNPTEWTI